MASTKYNEDIQRIISKVFSKAQEAYPHCKDQISKLRSQITLRGAENFVNVFRLEDRQNNYKGPKELLEGEFVSYEPKLKVLSEKLLHEAQGELADLIDKSNKEYGIDHDHEVIMLKCEFFEEGKDLRPDDQKKLSEFKLTDGRTLADVYEQDRAKQRSEKLLAISLEKNERSKNADIEKGTLEGKNLAERSKARLLENAKAEKSQAEKTQEKMKDFLEESQKIMTKDQQREKEL